MMKELEPYFEVLTLKRLEIEDRLAEEKTRTGATFMDIRHLQLELDHINNQLKCRNIYKGMVRI